jgi:hypothetical protein
MKGQVRSERDSALGAALVRLHPGATIRIHSSSPPARVEGSFVSATPTTLYLTAGVQAGEYPRAGIDSLWVRHKATRNGAIIGAVPGGVFGLLVGWAATEFCTDEGGDPCPEAVPLLGLGGAAAGALLGALIGSFVPKWQRRFP